MKLIRTSFLEIDDAPEESCCSQCQKPNPRVWTTSRYALDSTAERQGLLKINIGVYRCTDCGRYSRSNPEFIRPRHLYTNKIMNVAIASAIEDKMPVSRIRHRLSRDFGVKPAESVIREWIEKAGDEIMIDKVLPVAKEEFSGVLCVDEVYSGKLAILVATDPENNDALIAFDLSDKDIDQGSVKKFFETMRAEGIVPEKVITDGSSLYPSVVSEIWPKVAHQLCLFHLSQKVCNIAKKAVRQITKSIPKKPKGPRGTSDRDVVITALVKYRQGKGKRQIAKEVGISRNSLKKWISDPDFLRQRYSISENDIVAAQNQPFSQLSTKISNFTKVPDGWQSWDQIDTARKSLSKLAFRISTRIDKKPDETQNLYVDLKNTPLEDQIREIREFVVDWHNIWWKNMSSNEMQSTAKAKKRWDKLAEKSLSQACLPFEKFQQRMTPELFAKLLPMLTSSKPTPTNNSAERYARRIKNIQKSRYRLRTKESLNAFIKLEEIIRRNQLRHDELAKSTVFRDRGV